MSDETEEVPVKAGEPEEPIKPAQEDAAKPRPRVKKIPRPNEEEFHKQLAVLNEAISECQKKMDEIKQSLDSTASNQELKDQTAAALARLKEIQAIRKQILSEKEEIRKELMEAKNARDSPVPPRLRHKQTLQTPEDYDRAIKDLEFAHETRTLSKAEEQKILNEIKALNAAKLAASHLSDQGDAARKDKNALFERLKAKDADIEQTKRAEDEQRAIFEQLRDEQGSHYARVNSLVAERKILRVHLNELYAKVKVLRDDYRKKMTEYMQNEKEFAQQMREDRYKQQKAEREERDKRRAVKEAEFQETLRINPFTNDFALIENMMTYLRSFLPKQAQEPTRPEASAGPSAAAPSRSDTKQGQFVLKKRTDDSDLTGLFGGMKNKKKKEKTSQPAAPKAVKISHSLDKFKAFEYFHIPAPLQTSDVDTVIEALQTKKERLMKMQEVWQSKVDNNGQIRPEDRDPTAAYRDAPPPAPEPVVSVETAAAAEEDGAAVEKALGLAEEEIKRLDAAADLDDARHKEASAACEDEDVSCDALLDVQSRVVSQVFADVTMAGEPEDAPVEAAATLVTLVTPAEPAKAPEAEGEKLAVTPEEQGEDARSPKDPSGQEQEQLSSVPSRDIPLAESVECGSVVADSVASDRATFQSERAPDDEARSLEEQTEPEGEAEGDAGSQPGAETDGHEQSQGTAKAELDPAAASDRKVPDEVTISGPSEAGTGGGAVPSDEVEGQEHEHDVGAASDGGAP